MQRHSGSLKCILFVCGWSSVIGFAASRALAAETPEPAQPAISFDDQILPILRQACLRCHGETQRKGELDLRSTQSMLRGGNGGAAFKANEPDESLLIELIESGEMPPPKEEPRVAPEQLALLKAWIKSGAPGPKNPVRDGLISATDRKFWSFVRPVKAAVPAVQGTERVRTPIDAFVLQKLEAQGLTLNPDADRRVMVRRLFFDLVGLPPTPAEIDAYLSDTRTDAYERLVDRLLNSTHYGERWARHWLDTVGYADSNGRRGDEERRWAWRYRDYVIRAINDDKPYDQFLIQQIAGDELLDWRSAPHWTSEMVENLVATGYLRTARDATDTEKVDMLDDRYMALHDTVEVTVNSLLGLTIGCAKCHSHKYDPLPQADYYRLEAFFTPAYNPQNWIPGNHRDVVPEDQLRYLPEASQAELKADAAINGPIDAAIAELKKPLEEVKNKHRQRLRASALAKLPADVQAAFAKPAETRTADEQKLVAQTEPQLKQTERALLTDAEYLQAAKPFDAAITAANAARPPKRPLIWALWDLDPKPPETRLLIRGDLLTPGAVVQPGVLSVLDDPDHPCEIQPPSTGAPTTGYRTQLARWIASEKNPLTARVFVNRVWQHHFGRGIVATPNDFGTTGSRPSHPELLDWLAVDFMEQGWSLKALQRRIVMSSTYRQSAEFSEDKSRVDLDNILLWRKVPLRVEAEVLRDALLTVSGQLDVQMFGPGVPVKQAPDGQWIAAATGAAASRRSIYLLNKRSESLTFLTTFDAPVMELDCPERFCSTVPQQSLAMLNSPFVTQQAEALAERIGGQAPADTPGTIRWAFEGVVGRLPNDVELNTLTEFFEAELQRGGRDGRKHALFQLAHTLLNTNEFLYVD